MNSWLVLSKISLLALSASTSFNSMADDPWWWYTGTVDVGKSVSKGILLNCVVNGQSYYETYRDRPRWWTPPGQPSGTALSYNPDPFVTFATGNHTLQTSTDTPPGVYHIEWTSYGSVHCNGWFWDWIVTIRPTISAESKSIWWFEGEQPPNYPTSTALTASGSGPSLFKIVSGSESAEFENHSNAITSSGNSASIFSKATGRGPGDLKVTVTQNGVESTPYLMTVRSPKRLIKLPSLHEAHSMYGYRTQVRYKVQDSTYSDMPADPLPCNEKFTGPVANDYPGANWARGPHQGFEACSMSNFTDYIYGQVASKKAVPRPSAPLNPLGATAVHHFPGEWRVGGATVGSGTLVQTNTWQRHQDHAEHTNISAPSN